MPEPRDLEKRWRINARRRRRLTKAARRRRAEAGRLARSGDGGGDKEEQRLSPIRLFASRSSLGRGNSSGRRYTVRTSECFSFIDRPEEALRVLNAYSALVRRGVPVVEVDQSACSQIDICAASVLNVLALSAKRTHSVRHRGLYPADQEAREIVVATGLPKALGLAPEPPASFLLFPLTRGRKRPVSATTSSAKEIQTERLVDYLQRCLSRYGSSLTASARRYLADLIGEVLANAEDHSNSPDWWVSAYMRQPEGRSYGDCHLTIFSFGRTLAESLLLLPSSARLRREIDTLVQKHRSERLFLPSRWTEENLVSLYALQEGVSRFNTQTEKLGHRGFGTVKMIQMFQRLGRVAGDVDRPRMCVISGHTQIVFDNTYPLRERETGRDESRQVIAFNAKNDLGLPPDPRFVRNLRDSFPGTLISVRFFLDAQHLEPLEEIDAASAN